MLDGNIKVNETWLGHSEHEFSFLFMLITKGDLNIRYRNPHDWKNRSGVTEKTS